MPTSPPVLSLTAVTVTNGTTTILKNLSLTVAAGEILVIVGESGSGKTTLLKAISGTLQPPLRRSGEISLLGRSHTAKDLQNCYGRELGMLFQNAADSFCPVQTIGRHLWDAVRLTHTLDAATFRSVAANRAAVLGLPSDILEAYPQYLSGGMLQRAELLFPLVMPPKLLLADEPTSAADSLTQKKIADALLRLRRYHQTGIIFVTHDIRLARYLADTLLVLKQGTTIEYGPASEIIANPTAAYTKELLYLAGIRK